MRGIPPAAAGKTPIGTHLADIGTMQSDASRRRHMSGSLFGIHGEALQLRSQRMGLLTSNIANAATPGYKAKDIDFASALAARQNGASQSSAVESAIRYRTPVMPSLDGNTVELGTEQLAFAENAVAYSATLTFIQGRVNTLTRAIKGD
jgi:flagellar basal-body rod protein FlgB